MYPKCQRCGSKFDPAFSASRLLCGDCLEVVNGKFTFTAHVSPSASPETLQALGELLTLAAVQAEKGNLTPDAADLPCTCRLSKGKLIISPSCPSHGEEVTASR